MLPFLAAFRSATMPPSSPPAPLDLHPPTPPQPPERNWIAGWGQLGQAWLRSHPEILTLVWVVLIGGGTGLMVVLFRLAIDWIAELTLERLMGVLAGAGPWTLALIPTLGGLVVGILRWRLQGFSPGVASLTDATQPLPIWRPFAQVAAAAVSLGTGASLGPEGPSVEIGGSIGVLLSQALRVSQERRRLLLGAGVAAGLAAGFNAPIAGVFLALELFLNTTFATTTVGVVLLAAVVAALITEVGLDGPSAFTLPVYEVRSPWELPLYMGLGVLASVVSLSFVATLKLSQQGFAGKLPGLAGLGRIPIVLRPMVGGALVGAVALVFPQILGIGYETVAEILRNTDYALPLLLELLVVKLLMVAISSGSGLVGGIFAPAMFLGAALGAAYGKVMALLLPGLAIAAPPAYAMVGMAAVLAGTVRSPLTAILLLFELTRDYRIILPLMAAVGISVLLVEWIKSKRSDRLNLRQMGLNLEVDQTQLLLEQLPVTTVLEPKPLMLLETLPLAEAAEALLSHACHSALVVTATGQLVGIFTLQDLNRAIQAQSRDDSKPAAQLTLGQVCTRDLLYVYSHETLAEAAKRLQARGLHQLPVLDQHPPHAVLGLLSAEDIALACKLGFSRQLWAEHHHIS
jgi:H+/Cl- antiporter ClcA/predicted transcriptional regulator